MTFTQLSTSAGLPVRACSAVLLACFVAGAASARTFCVNPNKSSCAPTIQAGIDAASSGDTVKIASGVYFENVVIPPGRTGLRLTGKRSAILDSGDNLVREISPSANAIRVSSSEVRIEGITIRGGLRNHIRIDAGLSKVRVRDVRSIRAGDNFLDATSGGNEHRVEDCEVEYPGAYAVRADANDFLIQDNSFLGGSIFLEGHDHVIESNTISDIADQSAIAVAGHGVEISKNRTESTAIGISVSGDDAWVAKNRISNTLEGIDVSGDNPVVEKNELRASRDDGGNAALRVFCEASCEDARVYKNEVTGGSDSGIFARAAGDGMKISKNEVRDVGETAFLLNSDGDALLSISKNLAKRAGDDCFDLGNGGIAEKNEATLCGGSGFLIDGNDGNRSSRVEDNRVTSAGENGFTVRTRARRIQLLDNRTKKAAFSGFAMRDSNFLIGSQELLLEDNRSSGSRFDLCDEAVQTEVGDNDFETLAPVTRDGVDECPSF